MPRKRRHHNTDGRTQIKRERPEAKAKRLADKLGVPFWQPVWYTPEVVKWIK